MRTTKGTIRGEFYALAIDLSNMILKNLHIYEFLIA